MAAALSFVVCLLISAGFGAAAYQRWQGRNKRGAVRMAALALVPLGLDLAGIVRLGRKVVDAFGHWALHLVFDPLVWLGIVMLGVAALLWIATGFGQDDAEPSSVASAPRRAVGPSRQKQSAPLGEDAEIEAILRKHNVH